MTLLPPSRNDETSVLRAENRRLQEELAELRQWKMCMSTSMQSLQQQLRRAEARCTPPPDVAMAGPAAATLDAAVMPTAAAGSERAADHPHVRDDCGVQLATLRESLTASKQRIRTLEQALNIANAKVVVLETRMGHRSRDGCTPNTTGELDASSARLRLQDTASRQGEAKAAIAAAAAELRECLLQSGFLTLPLFPHTSLDIGLLAITLRDHCRLAVKHIRMLEALD